MLMRRGMVRLGPGLLVTAAFVGPGTVTTATLAGVHFGYALLWAILFSLLATIVLQEMAARLGIVTRRGLGAALREMSTHKGTRAAAIVMVVLAITIGNAAYQVGNITGAALGLEALSGHSRRWWSLGVGAASFVFLSVGGYLTLERLLVALVGIMGLFFMATALAVGPDYGELAYGLLMPRISGDSVVTVIALIGTTVVPYNLFLHSEAVIHKWPHTIPVEQALRAARLDTTASVAIGGIITLSIVVTAATSLSSGVAVESAADMANQLEPLLGRWAQWFFAAGLLAAGLTSAITAPLAAAMATSGILGWSDDARSRRFRAVWAMIVVLGTAAAALGQRPVRIILLAQAANGVLLPIVALFLLMACNRKSLMNNQVNGRRENLLGGGVVLIAFALGACQLWRVLVRSIS